LCRGLFCYRDGLVVARHRGNLRGGQRQAAPLETFRTEYHLLTLASPSVNEIKVTWQRREEN